MTATMQAPATPEVDADQLARRRWRRRTAMQRLGWPVLQAAALALPIVIWQLLASSGGISKFFWGEPSGIWSDVRGWMSDGTLWSNAGSTLEAALLGFVVGTLAGTVIGVALGLMPFARAVLAPFIAFFNGLPRIIFYPFFAIWLGYTEASKVNLVVFVIFFVVLLNVMAGMAELPADQIAHVRLSGGNRRQLVRHVYLPSMGSWLISSSRLSAGLALQAAVVSEFLGPTKGLGYLAASGTSLFDINQVWAAIVVVIVIGVLVDAALTLLQRWLLRWQG